MRGLVAAVTSCIGGKDERYAIRVKPCAPQPMYFVFKSMRDFEALWTQLEALVRELHQRPSVPQPSPSSPSVHPQTSPVVPSSVVCQWLASFVARYAFQTIIADLRKQGIETLTTLNLLLSTLVQHVSALYVENTILRCGCSRLDRELALIVRKFLEFRKEDSPLRKRQWVEIRPEEDSRGLRKRMNHSMPILPGNRVPQGAGNGAGAGAVKTRRLSTVHEEGFMVPPIRKVELAVPTPRRRGFAEVDISI